LGTAAVLGNSREGYEAVNWTTEWTEERAVPCERLSAGDAAASPMERVRWAFPDRWIPARAHMHTARTRRHHPAVNRQLLVSLSVLVRCLVAASLRTVRISPCNQYPSPLAMAWRRPGPREVGELQRANLKGHRLCHPPNGTCRVNRLPSAALFSILSESGPSTPGPPRAQPVKSVSQSVSQPVSQPVSQSASQPVSRLAETQHSFSSSTHMRRERERARGGITMPGVAETAGERASPGLGTEMADDGTYVQPGTYCTFDP
jgi:hypothetical protein